MSFEWHGFLGVAEELIASGRDSDGLREARLRSAMSRAYYGVFCSVRDVLAKMGHSYLKDKGRMQGLGMKSAHAEVWRLVREQARRDQLFFPQILIQGTRLWALRERADYEDDYAGETDSLETIPFQVRRAQECFESAVLPLLKRQGLA